jgi:hypothetical protein
VADRTYRLIVEGELSDDLARAFPGMALTRADGSTALTGTVRDQAELQGLLQRSSDLGRENRLYLGQGECDVPLDGVAWAAAADR